MTGPLKNPRHEQFVSMIAAGESPTKAYILAGFSEKGAAPSGIRLLKVAHIRARADYLKAQIEKSRVEKAAISKSWIVNTLRLNVERAMQEVEVLDSKGNGTGEYQYQGAVANRALELLGKELGMFTDRHEFSGALAIDPGRLALPDGQLDAMIAAGQLIAAGKQHPEETVQ